MLSAQALAKKQNLDIALAQLSIYAGLTYAQLAGTTQQLKQANNQYMRLLKGKTADQIIALAKQIEGKDILVAAKQGGESGKRSRTLAASNAVKSRQTLPGQGTRETGGDTISDRGGETVISDDETDNRDVQRHDDNANRSSIQKNRQYDENINRRQLSEQRGSASTTTIDVAGNIAHPQSTTLGNRSVSASSVPASRASSNTSRVSQNTSLADANTAVISTPKAPVSSPQLSQLQASLEVEQGRRVADAAEWQDYQQNHPEQAGLNATLQRNFEQLTRENASR